MESRKILTAVPLLADEIEVYRRQLIARFTAEKMTTEHLTREEAEREATNAWTFARKREEHQQLLNLFDRTSSPVGILWLDQRTQWGQPCLWIYDLWIHPAHRGTGLGRSAMQFVEREARRRDILTLGLHVFGGNEAARALYNSLGYQPTSIVMRKDLQ